MAGDKVIARVALPGRPIGLCGEVREVGARFVMVEFEDGRRAYYRPCQLQNALAEGEESEDPDPSLFRL